MRRLIPIIILAGMLPSCFEEHLLVPSDVQLGLRIGTGMMGHEYSRQVF